MGMRVLNYIINRDLTTYIYATQMDKTDRY